jgi:hypothetical protein
MLRVWETMRAALNDLAIVAPDWLRVHCPPEWVERYGPRSEDSRLPAGEAKRLALAEALDNREENCLMPSLLQRPPSGSVISPWSISCEKCGSKMTNGLMMWFAGVPPRIFPPASRSIGSPYDEQAHSGKKRSTQWVGYKVHLTETCEAHQPLMVTHVETTSAPITDDAMTATLHAELARKELLPDEHIVDTG